jgi:hypothetical protein
VAGRTLEDVLVSEVEVRRGRFRLLHHVYIYRWLVIPRWQVLVYIQTLLEAPHCIVKKNDFITNKCNPLPTFLNERGKAAFAKLKGHLYSVDSDPSIEGVYESCVRVSRRLRSSSALTDGT